MNPSRRTFYEIKRACVLQKFQGYTDRRRGASQNGVKGEDTGHLCSMAAWVRFGRGKGHSGTAHAQGLFHAKNGADDFSDRV